jgi:hypothetical protein
MVEDVAVDPAEDVERNVKIRVYAKRAQAREPLFDGDKVESRPQFAHDEE